MDKKKVTIKDNDETKANDKHGNKYNKSIWSLVFGCVLLFLGVILNIFGIGNKEFLGFSTVPMYLIYVGIIAIAISVLKSFSAKKRIVDERMLQVAAKANRITFMIIILFSFSVMIIDGINQISIPYSYFMSYFICGIVLVYAVSYKLILKYS